MSDSLPFHASRLLVSVAGWFAMVLIVAAYALVSSGRLKPDAPIYQWMNIAGGIGFVINSGANGAYPSVVLNIIWIGIGATALIQRVRSRADS